MSIPILNSDDLDSWFPKWLYKLAIPSSVYRPSKCFAFFPNADCVPFCFQILCLEQAQYSFVSGSNMFSFLILFWLKGPWINVLWYSCSLTYICIKFWLPIAHTTSDKAELFKALNFEYIIELRIIWIIIIYILNYILLNSLMS